MPKCKKKEVTMPATKPLSEVQENRRERLLWSFREVQAELGPKVEAGLGSDQDHNSYKHGLSLLRDLEAQFQLDDKAHNTGMFYFFPLWWPSHERFKMAMESEGIDSLGRFLQYSRLLTQQLFVQYGVKMPPVLDLLHQKFNGTQCSIPTTPQHWFSTLYPGLELESGMQTT